MGQDAIARGLAAHAGTAAGINAAGGALKLQLPGTLTGTPAVGATIYCDDMGWADPTYTWYRNGVAIAGASGPAYQMIAGDAGIYCVVTGTKTRSRNTKSLSSYLAADTRSFVLSPYLLVSGYTGPLMRLVRSSDSATMDVYPETGGQAPDVNAIAVWAGDSTLTVDALYDQTGNGWHHTAASASQRPLFNLYYKINGQYPIWWTGASNNVTMGLRNLSWTGQNTSFSNVMVMACSGCGVPNKYFHCGDGTTYHEVLNGTQPNDFLPKIDAGSSSASGVLRSQLQLLGTQFGAGSRNLYIDTVQSVGGGAYSSATITASYLGTDHTGYKSDMCFFAYIMYPAVPSGATWSADQAFLKGFFNVTYRQANTISVVFDGDSITFGNSGNGPGSTYGQNLQRQVDPLLPSSYNMINVGVPGQLATTMYTNRTSVFSKYDATKSRNVLHVLIGTNDINAKANGYDANTGANDIWTGALLPYIQAAQAVGFKVVVGTLLARTSWSNNAAGTKTPMLNALNALITGNAATYSYTVADYNALTLYYADGVHPVNQGYATMAPVCKAALVAAAA